VTGAYGCQPYHLYVPNVLKSGNLSLLEPSGPVQACNGTALPVTLLHLFVFMETQKNYIRLQDQNLTYLGHLYTSRNLRNRRLSGRVKQEHCSKYLIKICGLSMF